MVSIGETVGAGRNWAVGIAYTHYCIKSIISKSLLSILLGMHPEMELLDHTVSTFFLRTAPWHMEVPRLGMESEL